MRLFCRFLLGFSLPFFILLLLWGAGLLYFVSIIPDETPAPSGSFDAIIALTGGEKRVPYALNLLQKKKAPVLFISGVGGGFRVEDIEAQLDEELRHQIHYGTVARSTIGNARETLAWLQRHSYKNLLIVTANYHMPRTQLLFDRYLQDYTLSYMAVDPAMFTRDAWVSHKNSFYLVLSEYHKWIGTWIHLHIVELV